MKLVVLNIKSSKYKFFMELIKSLDFVEITANTKEEILANLSQSFKELKLYKEGKLQSNPAKQLLDEL